MATDKTIRTAIKTLLKEGSGADTRVITRWKLSLDEKDWKAAVRSETDSDKTDGWLISRRRRLSKKVGTYKWEYTYVYVLWYFRTVREGKESSNSEQEMNDLLDAVAEKLEENPTLGFDAEDSGVDNHEELQVLEIDTVDEQVHIAQCELTVRLTKQPA